MKEKRAAKEKRERLDLTLKTNLNPK